MDTEPDKRRDRADQVSQFVDALYAFAARAIRCRSRLRAQDKRDIAHKAYEELSEKDGPFPPLPMLEQAERQVNRVADRMQKRRQRREERDRRVESDASTKRRGRESSATEVTVGPPRSAPKRPVGVPMLCRHLATLGRGTRFEAEIAKLVVDAAAVVMADPRAFSAEEIGLFALAWRDGRSATEIVGAAGPRTPRAVTERLKRLNKKIENSLAGYLAATLPPDSRDRLAEMLSSEPAAKKNEISQVTATQGFMSM